MTTFEQLSFLYLYCVITLSLIFFSPLFFIIKKREKEGCLKSFHKMVIQISFHLVVVVVVTSVGTTIYNDTSKINRMDLKISCCTNVNIAELLGNIKCHWRIISALETLQAVEV